MRIGITCYPSYGGSGIVGAELGLELAKRGHSVHFVSYAPPMRLGDGGRDGVHFHPVDMFTYPLFEFPPYTDALASKLKTVAVEEKLDILHVHYAIPHSISAYLAREMLKPERYLPVVTTLHGTDITLVGRDPSFLPITQFGIEQSDGVTAISKYLRSATWETFCTSCDIQVIYNFIDADYYQRIPHEALKKQIAPKGEKIILHISTFRPIKRITDCIETVARMRELESGSGSRFGVKLVMCGDGPEREEAEKLASERGVSDAVIFAGKQPQAVVRDYLSIADLFLLTSQSESFGLVALEAMACEVPVVASRVGGLPEVIEHGVSGFLHPPDALDEMAASGVLVLRDGDRHRAIAQAACNRVREEFCAEKIVPIYEECYQSVVGG